MNCQWDAYLALLPPRMRWDVDKYGRESLQELRLRLGCHPKLIAKDHEYTLSDPVSGADMDYVINGASKFSPWAAGTMAQGFLSGPGGHRIGICGETIIANGVVCGIRNIFSLCIRTARDYPGIAMQLQDLPGSILIIGPPGSGKTTLLRDLIRQKSSLGQGSIGVVDQREELFPIHNGVFSFGCGENTDVLSCCGKKEALEMLLRSMGPRWVAVDEISSEEDCTALLKAGWCGVSLIATAHAENLEELYRRPVYRPLIEMHLFDNIVCMNRNQTYTVERMQ